MARRNDNGRITRRSAPRESCKCCSHSGYILKVRLRHKRCLEARMLQSALEQKRLTADTRSRFRSIKRRKLRVLAHIACEAGEEKSRETAELAQDRLSQGEWDQTSWSATRWLTYAAQRVSVALHKSVAYELLEAVGLASVSVCVPPTA